MSGQMRKFGMQLSPEVLDELPKGTPYIRHQRIARLLHNPRGNYTPSDGSSRTDLCFGYEADCALRAQPRTRASGATWSISTNIIPYIELLKSRTCSKIDQWPRCGSTNGCGRRDSSGRDRSPPAPANSAE